MVDLQHVFVDLNEYKIAEVHRIYDDARQQFRATRPVDTYDGYCEILADFAEHMLKSCVARGGYRSRQEALAQSREFLERDLRRKGLDFTAAFLEARAGLNGGLPSQLNLITEGWKHEATEHYITAVFERHFPPPRNFSDKVEAVRQLAQICGPLLGPDFDPNMPEAWANRVVELIRRYVMALQQVAATARRGD